MAGGGEGVGIEESADFGIIITAGYIIETRLGIVELATRAKMRHFHVSKTVQSQHPRKPWNRPIPWLLFCGYPSSINISRILLCR